MQTADIPVLSLARPPAALAAPLGEVIERFGFAVVADHGIPSALIEHAWALTAALFALPEAEKRAYAVPGIAGARGYTPFGREIAVDAAAPDLKEFWHIGRELPSGHPLLSPSMPANVWPARPERFRETFLALFAAFEAAGARLLRALALHLGLVEHWFEGVIADGNSVLRLLHYPPVRDAPEGALRAGAHGDINLITLLLGAEEAGLELLTREGEWREVAVPPGALVVNIGDMLARLTNDVLPSTLHRVRNPAGERAGFSRYSMPFFLHARSDFLIETLPGCISAARPDAYPPILVDDFLQQRLSAIGLR